MRLAAGRPAGIRRPARGAARPGTAPTGRCAAPCSRCCASAPRRSPGGSSRRPCPTTSQRERCLDALVADGLVEPLARGRFQLPGTPRRPASLVCRAISRQGPSRGLGADRRGTRPARHGVAPGRPGAGTGRERPAWRLAGPRQPGGRQPSPGLHPLWPGPARAGWRASSSCTSSTSPATRRCTVSLAGTIFAIPTDQARGQVAQFLLLTMAPFALLAPFIGPLLDRFRHGRRWAIGTTLAAAGLPLLGAGRRGGQRLAVAVPGRAGLPRGLQGLRRHPGLRRAAAAACRASASSRPTPATPWPGWSGMAVGGGLAAAPSRASGPSGRCGWPSSSTSSGTVLAIRLPATGRLRHRRAGHRRHRRPLPSRPDPAAAPPARPGLRARVAALPTTVLARAVQLRSGARLLTGFLTLFIAFLMREHPLPGAVGHRSSSPSSSGAAGAGNALGTLVGNALGTPAPGGDHRGRPAGRVVAALVTARSTRCGRCWPWAWSPALAAQLVKLGSDAVVQRDIGESVRTRVFAWSETRAADGLGDRRRASASRCRWSRSWASASSSALLVVVLLVTVRVRRHTSARPQHPPP